MGDHSEYSWMWEEEMETAVSSPTAASENSRTALMMSGRVAELIARLEARLKEMEGPESRLAQQLSQVVRWSGARSSSPEMQQLMSSLEATKLEYDECLGGLREQLLATRPLLSQLHHQLRDRRVVEYELRIKELEGDLEREREGRQAQPAHFQGELQHDSSMEETLNLAAEELDALKGENERLQHELAKCWQQYERDVVAHKEHSVGESSSLVRELEEARLENVQLRQHVREVEEQLAQLQEEHQELQQAAQQSIEQLVEEVSQAHGEREEFEVTTRTTVAQMREEVLRLEKENQEIREEAEAILDKLAEELNALAEEATMQLQQNYEEQVGALHEELSLCQRHVLELEEDLDAARAQAAMIGKEVLQFKSDLGESKREVDVRSRQLSHWQLEASKLSQELAVWREKCERGEARRADLELKSSRQKNEIQHMSGELDKAQATADQLKVQVEQLKVTKAEAERKVVEQASQISRLESDLVAARFTNSAQTATIAKLESDLQCCRSSSAQQMTKMGEVMSDLLSVRKKSGEQEKEISRLCTVEAVNAELASEIAVLKNRLLGYEADHDQLVAEKVELEQHVAALGEKSGRHVEEVAKLQADLAAAEHAAGEAAERVAALDRQLEDLHHNKVELTEEVALLETQLAEANATLLAKEEEANKLKLELEQMTKFSNEQAQQISRLADVDQRNKDLTIEISELKDQIQGLSDELGLGNEDRSQISERVRAVEAKNEKLVSDVKKLKRQLQKSQEDQAKLIIEKADLEREMLSVHNQLTSSTTQVSVLTQDLKVAQGAVERHAEEVARLEDELVRAEFKTADKVEVIKKLEEQLENTKLAFNEQVTKVRSLEQQLADAQVAAVNNKDDFEEKLLAVEMEHSSVRRELEEKLLQLTSERSQLESRMAQLEQEVNNLEVHNNLLREERQGAMEESEDKDKPLHEEAARLAEEVTTLTARLEGQLAECEALRRGLEVAAEQVVGLEGQTEDLTREASTLRQLLADREGDAVALTREKEAAVERLITEQETIIKLKEVVENLQKQLESENGAKAQSAANLQVPDSTRLSAAGDTDGPEEGRSTSQVDYNALNVELEEKLSKVTTERSHLESRVSQLEQEVNSLEVHNHLLREERQAAVEKLEELEELEDSNKTADKASMLTGEVGSLTARLEEQIAECATLKHSLEVAAEQVVTLEGQIEGLSTEASNLRQLLADREGDAVALTQEKMNAVEKLIAEQEANMKLKESVEELQKKLVLASSAKEEAEAKLQNQVADVGTGRIQQLELDLGHCRVDLQSHKEQVALLQTFRDKYESLVNEMTTVRAQLAQVTMQLEDTRSQHKKEVEQLRKENQQVAEKMQHKDQQLQDLEEKLTALEEKLSTVEKEKEALEREMVQAAVLAQEGAAARMELIQGLEAELQEALVAAEKVPELEKKIQVAEKEADRLSGHVKELAIDLQKVSKLLEVERRMVAELKTVMRGAQAGSNTVLAGVSEVADYVDRIASLEEELALARKETAERARVIAQLREKLAGSASDSGVKMARLESDLLGAMTTSADSSYKISRLQSELESKVAATQGKVAELEAALDRAQEEAVGYIDRIAELEARCMRTSNSGDEQGPGGGGSRRRLEYEEKLDALKKQLEEARIAHAEEVYRLEEKIFEAMNEAAKHRSRVQQLEGDLEAARALGEVEIKALEEKLDLLSGQSKVQAGTFDHLQAEFTKKDSALSATTQELDIMKSQLEMAEQQLRQKQQSLEEAYKKLHDLSSVAAELEVYKSKSSEAEKTLGHKDEAMTKLHDDLKTAQEGQQTSQEEAQRLRAVIVGMQQEIARVTALLPEEGDEEKLPGEDNSNSLRKQVGLLEDALASSGAELGELHAKVSTLEANLQEARVEKEQLMRALDKQDEISLQLQVELRAAEELCAQQLDEISELSHLKGAFQEAVGKFKEELAAYEQKWSSQQDTITGLQQQLVEMSEKCNHLTYEVIGLNNQVVDKEGTILSLRTRLEESGKQSSVIEQLRADLHAEQVLLAEKLEVIQKLTIELETEKGLVMEHTQAVSCLTDELAVERGVSAAAVKMVEEACCWGAQGSLQAESIMGLLQELKSMEALIHYCLLECGQKEMTLRREVQQGDELAKRLAEVESNLQDTMRSLEATIREREEAELKLTREMALKGALSEEVKKLEGLLESVGKSSAEQSDRMLAELEAAAQLQEAKRLQIRELEAVVEEKERLLKNQHAIALSLEAELQASEKVNRDQGEELAKLTTELEAAGKLTTELNLHVGHLEARLSSLELDHVSQGARLQEVLSELDSDRAGNHHQEKLLHEALENLEAERKQQADQSARLQQLESQVSESAIETEALKQQLSDHASQVAALVHELAEVKQAKDQAMALLSEREQDQADLQAVQDMQSEVARLLDVLTEHEMLSEELRGDVLRLEEKLKCEQAAQEELQQELRQAEADRLEQEAQNRHLRAEVMNLQGVTASLRQQALETAGQLRSCREDADFLRSECTAQRAEKLLYKQELATTRQELTALVSDLSMLTFVCQNYQEHDEEMSITFNNAHLQVVYDSLCELLATAKTVAFHAAAHDQLHSMLSALELSDHSSEDKSSEKAASESLDLAGDSKVDVDLADDRHGEVHVPSEAARGDRNAQGESAVAARRGSQAGSPKKKKKKLGTRQSCRRRLVTSERERNKMRKRLALLQAALRGPASSNGYGDIGARVEGDGDETPGRASSLKLVPLADEVVAVLKEVWGTYRRSEADIDSVVSSIEEALARQSGAHVSQAATVLLDLAVHEAVTSDDWSAFGAIKEVLLRMSPEVREVLLLMMPHLQHNWQHLKVEQHTEAFRQLRDVLQTLWKLRGTS